jgi:hypothetical protein
MTMTTSLDQKIQQAFVRAGMQPKCFRVERQGAWSLVHYRFGLYKRTDPIAALEHHECVEALAEVLREAFPRFAAPRREVAKA